MFGPVHVGAHSRPVTITSGPATATLRWPVVAGHVTCQYVPKGKMARGGITNLPQTPSAGGTKATYDLGGIAILDLRSHTVVNEFPFQRWSEAGHVMTRNPLKLSADGDVITMWAAPDNGEETAGTQIYTWQATLAAKG